MRDREVSYEISEGAGDIVLSSSLPLGRLKEGSSYWGNNDYRASFMLVKPMEDFKYGDIVYINSSLEASKSYANDDKY